MSKVLKSQVVKFIGIGLIMIAGLSLLVYPLVANTWNNYVQSTLISSYEETTVEQLESGAINSADEIKKALIYNGELLPSVLPDSFAAAEVNGVSDDYMSTLNVNGDGIMGVLQIPKINVKLPIYHTTSDEVLQIAVGHLEGSSLPVGGESTHCVLSAHRGLPSATLFTDLDKLAIGDQFLIVILDEYFAYEVDNITVTDPDNTDPLNVEAGKDYCTLLTCTPYGVNTQRLMVRGHRVEYVPETFEEIETPLFGATSLRTNYLLWVIVGLAVVIVVIILLYLYDKKKRKEQTVEVKDN